MKLFVTDAELKRIKDNAVLSFQSKIASIIPFSGHCYDFLVYPMDADCFATKVELGMLERNDLLKAEITRTKATIERIRNIKEAEFKKPIDYALEAMEQNTLGAHIKAITEMGYKVTIERDGR